MKTFKKIIGIILAVSMLTTLMPMSLFATDYSLTETEPDIEQMSAEEYAEWKASLCASDEEATFETLASSGYIRNDFIEAYIRADGHYTMGTTGGNPDSTTDNNKKLLFGHPSPWSTETLIKIDDTETFFVASSTTISDDGKQAVSTATINGVEVKQILTIENNTYTGNADVISIRYVMKNISPSAKLIGGRIMLDTMLGSNDGAPFRLPGIGNVTTDMEFYGDDIPEYWNAFDSLTNPTVISTGNFYRTVSERPDKVQFTHWPAIKGSSWNFSITPNRSFTSDSAVAAYFNPRTVLSGQSRTITTYYGINNFVADNTGDLSLNVTAPTSMGGEDGVYHNNPFELIAYIANNTNGTVENVKATIYLPEELQIEGSDSRIVELGDLDYAEETYVNWNIRAIPQEETKTVTLTIKLEGDGVETKENSYDIVLNATEDLHRYISFDLNGAEGEAPETQEVLRGEKGVEPTAPIRSGYVFGGWYANTECIGISWFDHHNVGELARADADVTLYAKWIEITEFDFERDIFAFNNTIDDFGNRNVRYKVTGDYLDVLKDGYNSRSKVMQNINKQWNESGAAFGMASVSALVKAGKLDVDFFQAGAEALIDFDAPYDNETIFNLITYYELTKYSDSTFAAMDVGEDEKENNRNLIEKLESSDYPVIFGFDVYKNNRFEYGDTVVAYDITETDDAYDVSVYDPDDNSQTIIFRVSKDFSEAAFVDTSYDDARHYSVTKYAFSVEDSADTYDYRNIQDALIGRGRENGFEGLSLMAVDESDVMRLTLNYDSFTVECSDGTSAEVVNGVKTDGDLDIRHSLILNAEGQELSVAFAVPKLADGEYYVITPAADVTSVVTGEIIEEYITNISDSSENGFHNEVYSESSSSVKISADGNLEIIGDDETFYSVLVSQNSNDVFATFEFDGTEAVINQNGDEFVIAGDNMSDTFVILSDGYSEAYFNAAPTSTDDVTITRDGNVFVALAGGEAVEETELGYSVIYYSLGGTLIDAETDIYAGETATRPEDPEREGFIFDGWYTSTAYEISELWDFENDTVNENVILYAKWLVDEDYMHSVTFKAEGHDDIIVLVRDGDSLEEIPAVPKNNGRPGQWDINDFDNITTNMIVNAIYPNIELDVAFSADSVTAIAGETVEIDVTVENTSGIGGYDLDVIFDSSVLNLTGIDVTDSAFETTVTDVATANENGIIGFTYAGISNITDSGKLCTLTFEISEDAEEGEYALDLVINDAFCYIGQEYGDLVAHDEDGVVEVTHDYSIEVENVPADCENDGYIIWECTNCGGTKTEVLEALGHDEIHHIAKDATCTEIGWYAYDTCSRCDYTTYEEIAMLGHDFSVEVENEPAECEEDGYIVWKCSRCSETETEVLEALGHDETHHIAKDATCTEIGWYAYDTCSRCDYTTYEEIPMLGHDMPEWETVPVSCTETVTLTRECRRNGCTHVETKTILPVGHNYESVVTKEATCMEPGVITYTCTRCGDSYIVNTFAEHSFTSETVPATCTEDGKVIYSCECGYSYEEVIPGGHDYVSEVTKRATAEEDGEITYTCRNCGDTYKEIIPAYGTGAIILLVQDTIPWTIDSNVQLLNRLLEDEYIAGWELVTTDTLATEDLSAYDVIVIANDQTTATYTRLAANSGKLTQYVENGGVVIYGACDHGWKGGDIAHDIIGGVGKIDNLTWYNYIVDGSHPIVLGTMSNGTRITDALLYGTYCSHSSFDKDTLPEGANIILQDSRGEPTLVEYGIGDGTVIATGLTWEFYYVRPQPGGTDITYSTNVFDDLVLYAISQSDAELCEHVYAEIERVSANCTEVGYIVYKCTECEHVYTVSHENALGHDAVLHEGKEPTCTEAGYAAYVTCNRCDYNSYTDLDALGHDLSDWAVTKPAKIGKDGEETRECSRCDYVETRIIDALPIPADTTIIMVEDVVSYAGGTVNVDVTIDENDGFGGLAFSISFDSSVLTLTSADFSDGLTTFTTTPIGDVNATGKITFVCSELVNITGNGKLATLTFDIADDVEPQVCSLVVDVPDSNFYYEGQVMKDLLVVAKDGEVDVQDYMVGDPDGNFNINIRDAALVLQYIAGWDVEINLAAADADGNGSINIRDAALILQYIAGWDVTLG